MIENFVASICEKTRRFPGYYERISSWILYNICVFLKGFLFCIQWVFYFENESTHEKIYIAHLNLIEKLTNRVSYNY